jgi:hypothetical protein
MQNAPQAAHEILPYGKKPGATRGDFKFAFSWPLKTVLPVPEAPILWRQPRGLLLHVAGRRTFGRTLAVVILDLTHVLRINRPIAVDVIATERFILRRAVVVLAQADVLGTHNAVTVTISVTYRPVRQQRGAIRIDALTRVKKYGRLDSKSDPGPCWLLAS